MKAETALPCPLVLPQPDDLALGDENAHVHVSFDGYEWYWIRRLHKIHLSEHPEVRCECSK